MKKTLALAIAVLFVLAVAAPVFAQSMTWSTTYDMDGSISLKKQLGHFCNTGAEMKQTINGEGEMTKVMDSTQVAGKITVSDTNDWVTAADAVRNLTVTSVIELCAPAKHVYDDEDDVHDGVVIPVTDLYAGLFNGEQLSVFDPDGFSALTKQIWAVQVEAQPGWSGNLHQDFEAANGPWEGAHFYLGDGDDAWDFDDDEDAAYNDVVRGDDYVGNYFNIEQMARTSQGTVKRFIDISSPWSHAYLMEDMTVTGFAEISEAFAMDNIKPGEEAVPEWWELF